MFELNQEKGISISKREKQVLILIARGMTCKEIASKLFISPTTVIFHKNTLMQKLLVKNSCELIYFACKNKLI